MINPNASHAHYSYDPFKAAEGARTSGSQIQGFSGQPDAHPRLRPATGNLTYQGSSGEPLKYATNQHYETKIVGSRILEPVEQLPPNVVMRKTNELYLQPEQLNSIQYVRPVANQASFVQSTQPVQRYSAVSQQSIPMSAIVQPIVQRRVIQTPTNITTQGPTIKQTVSKVATVETQPPQHLDPIVKYEYQKQPIVQTVRQSSWQSYYEPKKAPLVSAPPPAAPEKSSCSPILCAILGLLALGGLIAGIVLAAKANSGYGQPSAGISQTQGTISTDKASSGQSLYSNYTITVETTIINTTTTTTTTNSTSNSATASSNSGAAANKNSSSILLKTNANPTTPQTKTVTTSPVTVAPLVTAVPPTIPQKVSFSNENKNENSTVTANSGDSKAALSTTQLTKQTSLKLTDQTSSTLSASLAPPSSRDTGSHRLISRRHQLRSKEI